MTRGRNAVADIAEQPDVLASVVDRNRAALSEARNVIGGARVVRLAAIGSSRHAAGYGAAALDLYASMPAVVLPAPGAAVAVPPPRRDEPLIVASQSGRTPALLALAGSVRDAGTSVIAITNDEPSPLADIASVTLACGAGTERIVAATKSLTAQCMLLRALASEPSGNEIEELVMSLRRTLRLDLGAAVAGAAPATVVCAGFAAEWIADEIALKFTEMCGVAVTSGSVVEHFHGPRAGGGRVLAFLDPNDPNSGDLARTDHVVTVGPHPAFDVEVPSIGEPSLDALVTLIAGQRLALAWALHLGTDPDASRGLQKVTCTR